MQRSETIGALAAALSKAQAKLHGAVKDSKNPHFNSSYADLAAMVEACRAPLAENELAIIQSPHADANLVRMTTMIVHSSGEWIQSDPLQVQARDAAPQAVGSCLTYLRRYQLAAMVGIAPVDDDAEAAEGRQTPLRQNPQHPRAEAFGGGGVTPRAQTNSSLTDAVSKQRLGASTARPQAARPGIPEPPPISDKDIPFSFLMALVLPALWLLA